MNELKPCPFEAKAEAIAAWTRRRAQPEPAASADADYPCRSDGRCQYAIDHGAEGMGHCPRGKCAMADPAPSVAPEPVAWTLQSELDAAQTTCSAHLWFTNPRNSAWTALFTREQIAAHPPRAPLTEEQAQAMWTAATIEECSHENCYLRGLRDAEHAHGIGGK